MFQGYGRGPVSWWNKSVNRIGGEVGGAEAAAAPDPPAAATAAAATAAVKWESAIFDLQS